jgi:hypothetical protein
VLPVRYELYLQAEISNRDICDTKQKRYSLGEPSLGKTDGIYKRIAPFKCPPDKSVHLR